MPGPSPSDSRSTLEKAAGSVKWAALMEVAGRAVSPVVFVVLARLLPPEAFGVIASAMVAIGFAQIICDTGLGKAVIQAQGDPREAANVVFWSNLGLGAAAYGIVFLLAPRLADHFNSPVAAPVLRVLGIQIVVASLSSVPQALLVRDMEFRKLFRIRLATALVPAALSIPLALTGRGVWALVAGSLCGAVLNMVLLWRICPWRPRAVIRRDAAARIYRFGGWTVAEGLCVWFFLWGDSLLVGTYLGVEDLGIYRAGMVVSTAVFGLALNPFLPVLYPAFSRIQQDRAALRDAFLKTIRVVVFLALPMGTGLLLVSPKLVPLLFGTRWGGLGPILGILGFTQGVAWLVGINNELYRAMGRPDVTTKLLLATALLYLPAYLLAAPHGLVAFSLARLSSVVLLGIPLQVFACSRLLGISPAYPWREGRRILLATACMAAAVAAMMGIFPVPPAGASGAAGVAAAVLLGAGIYAAALWVFDRPFLAHVSDLVRRAAWS